MNATDPDAAFRLGGLLAMAGWAALALSPPGRRWTPTAWRLAGWWLPLVLALAYVALIVAHWGPGGFGSLAEVRALFASDGLLAAGWIHYLAFDLFVGTWIARDAARRGVRHLWVLPCLLLTFLVGPAGLLTYAALAALTRRTPT
ncbi:MAG: DUF4281 domain-containing protein [Rubrivivax sp.]|nr:DUF4281 domain-containing protein [Rubrivivax sp.]